jgi:hypothetical protein
MLLPSSMQRSPATRISDEREKPMRLLYLFAGYRLGSRHLMVGIETLLVLTLCLLLARAVISLS